MADYARLRALVPTLVSLATLASNIPVIFVTFRSPHFENDSVAKLMASLAVSDIGYGIFVAGCYAGLAWSLQRGDEAPEWLLRLINSGVYTFGVRSSISTRGLMVIDQNTTTSYCTPESMTVDSLPAISCFIDHACDFVRG